VYLEQNIANRDSVTLNLLLQQSAASNSTSTVCMYDCQISTYVAKVCVAMYATEHELCIFIRLYNLQDMPNPFLSEDYEPSEKPSKFQ
jgi:hypothetical protein